MDSKEVQRTLKEYVLREFLPGEDPSALTESTPLVTSGVLDSLATLKLVSFLEDTYGISLDAHELDVEHLDTITLIAALVLDKKRAG